MALEEFTGFIFNSPWSLGGITNEWIIHQSKKICYRIEQWSLYFETFVDTSPEKSKRRR